MQNHYRFRIFPNSVQRHGRSRSHRHCRSNAPSGSRVSSTHHFPHHRHRNHCYRYCRCCSTYPSLPNVVPERQEVAIAFPFRRSVPVCLSAQPNSHNRHAPQNNLADRSEGIDNLFYSILTGHCDAISGLRSLGRPSRAFFYQFPR